tara:strand:+ start:88 stop:324 length:237 start_codon:yes stop_codon:yes gene_type:complete
MHEMNGDEEFIVLIGGGQASMKSAKAGPNYAPQSPGGQVAGGDPHKELLTIAGELRKASNMHLKQAEKIEAMCEAMKY